MALQKLHTGHDHTGRAVAALQAVAFPETFLYGVQLPVAGQTLDGGNFTEVSLDGEDGTGFHGETIQQYRASPADAGFAADVRAGQTAHVAQKMDKEQAGFDFVLVGGAVDTDGDESFHMSLPSVAAI